MVFVNVPVILPDATPLAAPPVKPDPVGALQVYVVPVGITPFVPFVGVTLKLTPAQMVVDIGVTVAVGLTVTVQVNVAFTPHKDDVGVTIYVAVC